MDRRRERDTPQTLRVLVPCKHLRRQMSPTLMSAAFVATFPHRGKARPHPWPLYGRQVKKVSSKKKVAELKLTTGLRPKDKQIGDGRELSSSRQDHLLHDTASQHACAYRIPVLCSKTTHGIACVLRHDTRSLNRWRGEAPDADSGDPH